MAARVNQSLILLAEDDETLGYALSEYLKLHGFRVIRAKDGPEAYAHFREHAVDLCILDVNLPGMDGFSLAGKIRQSEKDVPFLFMTARSLKVDKLKGFSLGADDYITKPVEEEEMIARIHAILRRSQNITDTAAEPVGFGNYWFDPERQELHFGNASEFITEKEGRLLELLVRNKNQLVRRDVAMRSIWGAADYFTRKTMDVYMYKLRRLLSRDESVEIINIRGKGFILQENAS